jgi:hypothetical protein
VSLAALMIPRRQTPSPRRRPLRSLTLRRAAASAWEVSLFVNVIREGRQGPFIGTVPDNGPITRMVYGKGPLIGMSHPRGPITRMVYGNDRLSERFPKMTYFRKCYMGKGVSRSPPDPPTAYRNVSPERPISVNGIREGGGADRLSECPTREASFRKW